MKGGLSNGQRKIKMTIYKTEKEKKKKKKELMNSLNNLYNMDVLDDETYCWIENNINNL